LVVAGQDHPYGGDVITVIQGEPITDMEDLITYLVDNTIPLGMPRSENRMVIWCNASGTYDQKSHHIVSDLRFV